MVSSALGWVFIAPCAALVPKRRDWVAVIGREDGKFLDNSKYFFIEAALGDEYGLRVAFVTERGDVQASISAAGLESIRFPSLAAVWFLARCGTVVVDSIEWRGRCRRFLLARARLVQLWHGVGFKRIELDKWRNEAPGQRFGSNPLVLWVRMLRKWLGGRVPLYDAVVTTSEFYRREVFEPAFRSRQVITTGYPRNTFGQLPGPAGTLAWDNVEPGIKGQLRDWRAGKRKIVLFAPTFRDTRATPLALDAAAIARLETFCSTGGYEMLFKFHPLERGTSSIAGQHLHVLASGSDVYPLLPFVDCMVTDYSSIYMDFLLLDRPVLFFTPDLDQYLSSDRNLQFDFDAMTPGPKLATWRALLDAIQNGDEAKWRSRRAEICTLAFDGTPPSGATRRLLDFMSRQGWILRKADILPANS